MSRLNRITVPTTGEYTEKIIQFGEGNFLRAFADWIVWKTDRNTDFNASVVVVQPRANGRVHLLNEQDCLYHLNLQGLQDGKPADSLELIDVISRGVDPYVDFEGYLRLAELPEIRFVISNTTEAGIAFDPECRFDDAPARSFPGKLTQLLFRRWEHFEGAPDKGLLIFPCELIFENGKCLKECILQYIDHWGLDPSFRRWFLDCCGVYSTLVDRITPGYSPDAAARIMDRTGIEDHQLVQAEIYHLWVIEAPESVSMEFPVDRAGLNVHFVPSEAPYHERKVTLLNGPHTVLAPVGYLSGLDTVRECCEHPVIGKFVEKVMFHELIDTLNLPREELESFASAVMDRFRNPFVKHFLTSIMLNSFPKFKTRDLPGLKVYLQRNGELPEGLVLGLAGIVSYYKGGKRGGTEIVPNDDPAIVSLLAGLWDSGDVRTVAERVLAADFIWGEDLSAIPGLAGMLAGFLKSIEQVGMLETVKSIL